MNFLSPHVRSHQLSRAARPQPQVMALRFSSLPQARTQIVRTQADYLKLTEEQKAELRDTLKRFLISDSTIRQGIQSIVPLARELSSRYPESHYHRVGFGRSPLLFLEVLGGLETHSTPYTAMAGTHFIQLHHDLVQESLMDKLGAMLCDTEPVTDRRGQRDAYDTKEKQIHLYLKNYQAYLQQKGLDPTAIIASAKQGKKTIILDRVETGLSIEMLARILYQWAQGQDKGSGQEKALTEAVQFYLLPTSASDKSQKALDTVRAMGFKVDFPTGDVNYTVFSGAKELGVKFDYQEHDMLARVLDREERLENAADANAIRFTVLDSLLQPNPTP